MRLSDLNISFITQQHSFRLPASERDISSKGFPSRKLTRREFLGSSIAAATVSQIPLLASIHRLAGRMRIVHFGGRLSFQIDDQDVFVIDERHFAGKPKLEFSKSSVGYMATLLNARFPGTDLIADLSLNAWQGLTGWHFTLLFKALGSPFSGNLESFLLGDAITTAITGSGPVLAGSVPESFKINGPVLAGFSPAWRLSLADAALAELIQDGQRLLSREFAIQLASGTSPSLLKQAPAKKTRIELLRGSNDWNLHPGFKDSAYRLRYAAHPFDALTIESAENTAGDIRTALLASGSPGIESVMAEPKASFISAGGEEVTFRLRNVRYARSYQDGSEFFSGYLPEKSTWIHPGGLSIGLDNKSDGPSFQLQSNAEGCTDAVDPRLSLAPNLPGAIVITTDLPDSVSVPLTFGKFKCEVKKFLHFDGESKRVCLRQSPIIVKLQRPRDLLNLVLEFHCMEFHCHHGDAFFTVAGDKKIEDARVIVYFPGQSIGEECFKLGDPSCGAGNQDLAAKKGKVKTRLAQRSRLVFQPPFKDHDTRLPFTLKSLLNWSKWKLKVTKFAKPPIDINGAFTPDGRIEADFICDFTDATIAKVDTQNKIVTVDQRCEKRFTRFQVFVSPPDPPKVITKTVVQLLDPFHLQLDDVTELQAGQRCIISVPCKPLPDDQRPKNPPAEPQPLETSIELPYRLVISPNEFGQFRNSPERDQHEHPESAELWHSSLITGAEEPDRNEQDKRSHRFQTIRAVWSPDIGATKDTRIPFETEDGGGHDLPMTALNRSDIIKAFTDYTLLTQQNELFNPVSMPVRTLALSSLGGWIDGAVAWEPPLNTDLASWQQRTAAARDNLVKLEFKGFLVPTGHRVTLLIIIQREWCKGADGKLVAILVKRCQILIPRPLKTYPAIGQLNNSRDFSFKSARILAEKTPFLDPGGCDANPETLWPQVCGNDYRFPLELIDLADKPIKVDLPMLFVSNRVVFTKPPQTVTDISTKIIEPYRKSLTASRQTSPTGQQKITYAPPSKPADTEFTTVKFLWNVTLPLNETSDLRQTYDQPPWYPTIERTTIQLNSVQSFSQKQAGAEMVFAPAYIEKGFPEAGKNDPVTANHGEVIFQDASESAILPASLAASGLPSGLVRNNDGTVTLRPISALTSSVGDLIIVSGADNAAYNGQYRVLGVAPGSILSLAPQFGIVTGTTPSGKGIVIGAGVPANLAFPGDKGGGIIVPSTSIGAVSRKMGPVGGQPTKAADNTASGTFDPKVQFTGSLDFTLLGAISLKDLIAEVIGLASQSNKVPKLIQQEIKNLQGIRDQITSVKNVLLNTIKAPFDQVIPGSNPPATLRQVLQQFQDAANAEAQKLVLHTISAAVDAITSLLGQNVNVNGVVSTALQYQKDASDLLQIAQTTDLPKLREFFVQQIKAQVPEEKIQDLRAEFENVGQLQVRAVQNAIVQAQAQIQNAVGAALLKALGHLDEALTSADILKIEEVITELKAAFDEVLAFASAVESMRRQIENVFNTVRSQIDLAKNTITASLDVLKNEADQAVWALEAAAKQAIKEQIDKFHNTIQAQIDVLRQWPDATRASLEQYVQSKLESIKSALDQKLNELRDALLQQVLGVLDLPTAIKVSYEFEPQLQDAPADEPIFKASRNGDAATLVITSQITKSLIDTRPPQSTVTVDLKNFELHLFPFAPFIVLPFETLKAETVNGGSPNVTIKIVTEDIRFLGPLDFVQELETFLKIDGFSVAISPAGISAALAVNLPDLSFGAFNVDNISFNTSVVLSFLGNQPVIFRFAFSERARPCLLSFGIFGGTFFMALELRSQSNVVKIEAAIEFGAVAELNLGVAHGGVHIFGGFYFLTEPNHLILSGYLRAGGELTILEIVSMSVEFNLSLVYENRNGAAFLVGECTLTVEVHVLFFSASVRLSMRREFSKSGGGGQAMLLDPLELPPFSRALEGNAVDSAYPGSDGRNWVLGYKKLYSSYAW